MRCKTLTAIYKNEINTLKKLYEIDFLIHKSVRIHIEQFTVRKIEIDFTSEQLVDDLIAVLTKVERLLMLFDGYFMNLISIEFQDSAGCVPPNLKECAEHFMRRRLAYFHSNKILFSSNYLLDFSKVLTPALYEKWKGILEDLDVAHQVYLYSLCDTNQPVDLRCAFLIELAEPVVEIVKANSPLFESLNPGKQGTSLRDCLRALITTYGSDIFENEINSCFETFLKSLVNSRVRIMHIKRNCSGSYLNGPESVLYSIKISFLYRIVLFNLLGISPSLYHENLISNIQRWNSWNDIMDQRVLQSNISYYLKENPGAWLVYETGYKKLFGFTGTSDVQDTLLAGLLCALCFSGLFAMERKGGMDEILASTPLGRKYTVKAKLRQSTAVASVIAFGTVLPHLWQVLRDYGLPSLLGPAMSISDLQAVPKFITLSDLLLFWLICRFAACLCMSRITLWLGQKLGNLLPALFISAVSYCLPALLSLSGMRNGIEWLGFYPLFHAVALWQNQGYTADGESYNAMWIPIFLVCAAFFLAWAIGQALIDDYDMIGVPDEVL